MKLSSVSLLQLPSQLNPLLLPKSRGLASLAEPPEPDAASGSPPPRPAPPAAGPPEHAAPPPPDPAEPQGGRAARLRGAHCGGGGGGSQSGRSALPLRGRLSAGVGRQRILRGARPTLQPAEISLPGTGWDPATAPLKRRGPGRLPGLLGRARHGKRLRPWACTAAPEAIYRISLKLSKMKPFIGGI